MDTEVIIESKSGGNSDRRMTLEEISEIIGISRTTIYKVIRNKGVVSDKTREKVEQALEKYHYVENKNARNLAMNRQYTIGYVGFRSRSSAYFSPEVRKGLDRAIREFGDDGLNILISEFDVHNPMQQMAAVDQMLREGVRSFVLAFSDTEVIRQILEKLKKLKCLVVLLSRDLQENTGNHYVGVDYYQSGVLAAELLGKMLPQGGSIFVPVTEEYLTNRDIQHRLNAFLTKMQEFPSCEVLPVVHGLTEAEEIRREVKGAIAKNKDLAGIFDLTYRLDVVADVLREEGREDLRLTGFDLYPEIMEDVQDSLIDAVVYQDLNKQAYEGMKLLFEEMCYGKQLSEKKHYSKLEVVMSSNLSYFR